jgi:tryptophanase
MSVKLSNGKEIPIEMHKIRIVQQTNLLPAAQRLKAMDEAGYNTFLLRTRSIFLDMLTDSGTNAMTDQQLGAMMCSDDAYAGSESFYKLADAVDEVFGYKYLLPTHQGRAAEHLLAKVFVKPGDVVPMNYHFTTTKAHFEMAGGTVHEIYYDEALNTDSTAQFKGNIDPAKLEAVIAEHGAEKVSFVRMEATTNLLGGQPFSMANLREIKAITEKHGLLLMVDASLISENAYFIRQREEGYADTGIKEIIREIMAMADICYLSGRKSCSVRGGFIATNIKEHYDAIAPWLPLYEGFYTYGGMSSKEVEAMAVGIREMCAVDVAGSSADVVKYFVGRLKDNGVPVVTPAGGLACHVDASRFLPNMPQQQYPAGALAAAVYITSGIRTMERGTLSTDRDKEGNEVMGDLELVRFAVPRRTYTMSHVEYAVDRVTWLYKNRHLIEGLTFNFEPPVLRFFAGKLDPMNGWGAKLVDAFEAEFGKEC